jgi:hypothetical protein
MELSLDDSIPSILFLLWMRKDWKDIEVSLESLIGKKKMVYMKYSCFVGKVNFYLHSSILVN